MNIREGLSERDPYRSTPASRSKRWPDIHPHAAPDILDERLQAMVVEVRATGKEKTGRGLFTRESIQQGKEVFSFDGEKSREPNGTNLFVTYGGQNGIVVGKENPPVGHEFIWAYPDDKSPLRYLNHSCNPTVGRTTRDAFQFVALHDLAAGDEITADYSLLETNPHWGMRCECGAENCRHIVGSIGTLPVEYLAKNWHTIPEFMQRWVVANSSDPQIQSVRDKEGATKVWAHFLEIFSPEQK